MKILNNYSVNVNGEIIAWFETSLEASKYVAEYNSKNEIKCEFTKEVI